MSDRAGGKLEDPVAELKRLRAAAAERGRRWRAKKAGLKFDQEIRQEIRRPAARIKQVDWRDRAEGALGPPLGSPVHYKLEHMLKRQHDKD